jgi:PAS domain S-box-containing protein
VLFRSIPGYILAILIITISSVLVGLRLYTLYQDQSQVSHTLKNLTTIDETLDLINDAEAGERSYILTGDLNFLESYDVAFWQDTGIKQHIQDLRLLTADDPKQQKYLDLLEPLISNYKGMTAYTIELKQNDKLNSPTPDVITSAEQQTIENIQSILSSMQKEEKGLLADQSDASATSLKNAIYTIEISTFISILLLLYAFWIGIREITERRRAEKEIRKLNDELETRVQERTEELSRALAIIKDSEKRLRDSLDSMMEGCQIISFDWEYLFVNQATVKQSKTTEENLIGHKMMDAYPGIENTEMFAHLRKCMEQRVSNTIENEFVFPDGSKGWFNLSINPVPEGIFIQSIDITDRKFAEEKVNRKLQYLQSLREIDSSIIENTDIYQSLRTILERTQSQLHVDAADVLLLNPRDQTLNYAAGIGFHSQNIELSARKINRGIVGSVMLDGGIQHISDFTRINQHLIKTSLLESEGFTDYYVIPLNDKGITLGILEVFHRQPRNLDLEELDFLNILAGQTAIAIENNHLYTNLQNANLDLLEAYNTTIEGWSHALDLRDRETEGHTLRVTEMTLDLARLAGMSEEELVHIRRGALLHDIGKMGVPDDILLKPARLTDEEWAIMVKHPIFAYDLLSPIAFLRPAIDIPYCHHEKWDGTGYPRGLKGEEIPFSARLFAVVDVWDALISDRPYRKAWPKAKVIDHIKSLSGTHFDPRAVEYFFRLVDRKTGDTKPLPYIPPAS